jgi:CBS domain-containing protein
MHHTHSIRDTMTSDPTTVEPHATAQEAARLLESEDVGSLPVVEDGRLVGMITDRDIAIRAVARDLPPSTPVADVMSREVLYCFEDEDIQHVAANMGDQQVRRLPVLSREKRLVGIVSIGDLARHAKARTAGEAVAAISRPGGAHDQTLH